MNETIIELVEMFFTLVLVPLLTYGMVLLGQFLKSKTKSVQMVNALTMAEEAVRAAVAETAQTFVDQLKEEGRFNEEAMNKASQAALLRAKGILGYEGELLLKQVVRDVNEFLTSKIEEEVRKSK